MQEDTKPENDDIQDEERKKPFSRSEYHGVITSYAGLALSLIAIILSVITMYQSHAMQTREIVQILRAEDDGYYHFDGEKLFKNFQVTVANNSAIPVSVVEITVERDGEARTFEISDLPDILPLNMEANHTEVITIPWNIALSNENFQMIRNTLAQYTENQLFKSDSVLSSEFALTILSRNAQREQAYMLTKYLAYSAGVADFFHHLERGSSAKLLSLSVAVQTAKNHQYIFTTEDIGAPESIENEDDWVANMMCLEYYYQSLINNLEGVETP